MYRFNNRQVFNELGMRRGSLDELKDRKLILVFGDSLLNSGSLIDQAKLATDLASNDRFLFGKLSAGSWGRGNHRAWMDTFGLIGASTVIFVYSSHDVDDQPDFKPLDPTTHPTRTPFLVSFELATRYIPRYLPKTLGDLVSPRSKKALRQPPNDLRTPTEKVHNMLGRLAREQIAAYMLLHPTQLELSGTNFERIQHFQDLAARYSIPAIELNARYRVTENTAALYVKGDDIHINARGQRALAAGFENCRAEARIPKLLPSGHDNGDVTDEIAVE
jgi:hypothetical protein